MCGIAGFLTAAGTDSSESNLSRMADAIRHRGPNDSGLWADRAAGIGLAHRRLSIVDLSPADVVLGATEPATVLTGAAHLPGLGDVGRMMALYMLRAICPTTSWSRWIAQPWT